MGQEVKRNETTTMGAPTPAKLALVLPSVVECCVRLRYARYGSELAHVAVIVR